MPSIVPDIRRRGFRKWYERELLRGHAHLVLLLLGTVAAMAAVEAFHESRGADRLLMGLCLLLASGVGIVAIRRYAFHLTRAESVAHQAACPACHDWGGWQADADEDGPQRLQVRCRRCGERWTIRC